MVSQSKKSFAQNSLSCVICKRSSPIIATMRPPFLFVIVVGALTTKVLAFSLPKFRFCLPAKKKCECRTSASTTAACCPSDSSLPKTLSSVESFPKVCSSDEVISKTSTSKNSIPWASTAHDEFFSDDDASTSCVDSPDNYSFLKVRELDESTEKTFTIDELIPNTATSADDVFPTSLQLHESPTNPSSLSNALVPTSTSEECLSKALTLVDSFPTTFEYYSQISADDEHLSTMKADKNNDDPLKSIARMETIIADLNVYFVTLQNASFLLKACVSLRNAIEFCEASDDFVFLDKNLFRTTKKGKRVPYYRCDLWNYIYSHSLLNNSIANSLIPNNSILLDIARNFSCPPNVNFGKLISGLYRLLSNIIHDFNSHEHVSIPIEILDKNQVIKIDSQTRFFMLLILHQFQIYISEILCKVADKPHILATAESEATQIFSQNIFSIRNRKEREGKFAEVSTSITAGRGSSKLTLSADEKQETVLSSNNLHTIIARQTNEIIDLELKITALLQENFLLRSCASLRCAIEYFEESEEGKHLKDKLPKPTTHNQTWNYVYFLRNDWNVSAHIPNNSIFLEVARNFSAPPNVNFGDLMAGLHSVVSDIIHTFNSHNHVIIPIEILDMYQVIKIDYQPRLFLCY